MNIALKVAIAARGITSREVSLRTHIPEVRLSGLIHRKGPAATPREKTKLARVLQVDRETLFPSEPTVETAAAS